jgi:hypothetical protein
MSRITANEILKQALLVAEIEIDRSFRDACAPGDVVEAGVGKPARGKFIERGIED